jgi:hypothetical protein
VIVVLEKKPYSAGLDGAHARPSLPKPRTSRRAKVQSTRDLCEGLNNGNKGEKVMLKMAVVS